jgi:hypothetical protein
LEKIVRKSLSGPTAEARIVKRYHKLYTPLIELVQAVQDIQTDGIQAAEIELTRDGGEIVIECSLKATRLIINDDNKRFILQIETRK